MQGMGPMGGMGGMGMGNMGGMAGMMNNPEMMASDDAVAHHAEHAQ